MSLARNSGITMAGAAVPLVSAIATVPLYISEIGAARYGALVIAWTMLGYFGQADFGIGRALTQRIAAHRNRPAVEQASIVWSGIAALLFGGLIMGATVYGLADYFFGHVMEVDAVLRAELVAAVLALALCNPVVTLTGAASGALIGQERFGAVTLGNLIGNLSLQLLPLIAAWTLGHDMVILVVASLVGRVLGLVVMGTAVWRVFLSGHRVVPRLVEMRRLAHFGIWVMIASLVAPLMIYSDRFVIAAAMGAAAVAAYTIPYQIAYRTLILPQSMIGALFPRFAALEAARAVPSCRAFLGLIAQTFGILVVGGICLAGPLMHAWLGGLLDPRSIDIARIILAGVWLLALASVPQAFLQARGAPRFTAVAAVVELPFYIALLYVLGSAYGLAGFAAAFLLRALVDSVILSAKADLLGWATCRTVLPPAAVVGMALFAAPALDTWPAALIGATVLCSLNVAILYFTLGHMPIEFQRVLVRLPMLGPLLLRLRPDLGSESTAY